MDGTSLLSDHRRPEILIEYGGLDLPGDLPSFPPYAGLYRPGDLQYTEYYAPNGVTVDFREYYDLERDPWQLTNLLGNASAGDDPNFAPLAIRERPPASARGLPAPDPAWPMTLRENPKAEKYP